jgi:hypothetical protein
MNLMWLLRASKWARNPPSVRRVKMVLGILLVIGLLYGIEALWGWPDWATIDRGPRGRVPR